MTSTSPCLEASQASRRQQGWTLLPPFDRRQLPFRTLDDVFALQGERLGSDALSEVLRVEWDAQIYYVKRYRRAGKYLRRFVGRSRIRAEWENLLQLQRWGLATPPIVGYGEQRTPSTFRGALITMGIPATDLATLARQGDPRLRDRHWLDRVSHQLADATRTLHQRRFTHNDLKWRNLLVDEAGHLFFIDCPGGSRWYGPVLRYRIIKDLACLDKMARRHLSRSRRLRFYLDYLGVPHLRERDKTQLRKLLQFFRGRD